MTRAEIKNMTTDEMIDMVIRKLGFEAPATIQFCRMVENQAYRPNINDMFRTIMIS